MLAIGILCFIFLTNGLTYAQQSPPLCTQSSSMTVNSTEFNGTWWEVARNPAPTGNWDCVEVNFIMEPQNTARIATTYSNTPSYLWVNQTMYTDIALGNVVNGGGYNISYINGLSNTSYTVYKLLDTDYENYAFVCGYTNASDPNTFFGIILTRDRYPNTTALNSYEAMASQNYANFTNGTMSLITQSPTCYAAGAYGLRDYAILATLLAALHALVHIAM
uniref:Lipocalin/cytosolic fatty-acid binding domain-containing protein n=1 Tax=Musca domestica TaxID=7370 RepID=A0A1I8N9X8_MUSDO